MTGVAKRKHRDPYAGNERSGKEAKADAIDPSTSIAAYVPKHLPFF